MKQRIAIAGAGPVGLAAALCLARAGHEVRVFEKRDSLPVASRASTFHAPTLDMLAALGVLEEVAPLGRRVDEIHYYRCNTGRPELAARFPFRLLAGQTGHPWRMHLEQALLTPALLRALGREAGARVEFNAAIIGAEERRNGLEVVVQRGGGHAGESFDWLIGADGAKSAVRESRQIAFDGGDYEKRVLRLMTRRDLREVIPGLSGIAYLYNDSDSVSLLEMREVWRVILRLPASVGDEEAMSPAWRNRELARFLPLGGELPLVSTDVYRTSQRIAAHYRHGRVLLAGDAAHLTNTRGGMNMNCGLHDAWTLGEAFRAADLDASLGQWARARRAVAIDELIPRTDRSVGGGATWFAAVEAAARDPERAKAFVRDAAMLDIAPAIAPPSATAPAERAP
jgi:2-polyprenyl-6-methoxyphenol hydroxylase-like FAD-dependent oxidoreductase